MAATPTRIVLALAALLLVLAAAPAANAGQASVQGTTVVYTDTPGDARAISWARDSASIAITETLRDVGSKVNPTAGAGCTVYQPNNATATYVCTGDGLADVRIELGDGDDAAQATQTSAFNPPRYFQDLNVPATVIGGDGNDDIAGGLATDTLDGGPGDDQLYSDTGSHGGLPETAEQPAADTISGGPGNDTIAGGKIIDGGEGDDRISSSRFVGATINGGPGTDSIQGSKQADTIDGGDGPDDILSSEGNDTVSGGAGDDTIDSGEGDDTIDGGDGADKVDAGKGADRVGGGDGPDNLDGGSGRDLYFGGAGNDTLVSDDGEKDIFDCGAGIDTANWDKGIDKAVPRASCEHVPEIGLDLRRSLVLGYAKGAKAGRLKVHFQCVDCEKVTVRLSSWQFWNVPRIPGRAIGGGCGLGKAVKLKRTSLDNFDGVVPLNKCERQRLSDVVALERRGKAKLRRFEFRFGTDGGTSGEAFIGGRR